MVRTAFVAHRTWRALPHCTRSYNYARRAFSISADASSQQQPQQSSPSNPDSFSQLLRLQWSNNHHKGTAFERLSVALLSAIPSLQLTLQRRGGRSDLGVDFFGSWRTPVGEGGGREGPVHRLIGQCKMEGSTMGPVHLRSLEGTVTQYAQAKADAAAATIGVLVSAQPYSREAEAQWRRSRLPLVLVTIDPVAAIDIVADVERSAAEGADLSSNAHRLLPCLRRFSLNPSAAALLPGVRVKRVPGDGQAQPHITVLHSA